MTRPTPPSGPSTVNADPTTVNADPATVNADPAAGSRASDNDVKRDNAVISHPDPAIAAVETAADEAVEPTPSLVRRVLGSSSIWTFGILGVFVLVFSIVEPEKFPTAFNTNNILANAAILLVIAVGMTFVIITSGIDLSVGSVLVLSAVISVKAMDAVGESGTSVILVGLAAALAVGIVAGVVNGALVAYAKVPALIVTLGSLGAGLGLARILSGGIDLRTAALTDIGYGEVFGIKYLVLIAIGVVVIGAFVLHLTRFGRYTYAIGSNDEAARRSGVNVRLHLVKVYALSGVLAGLAGFLSLAKFGTTGIGGHSADNLNAIAAVVLGGTSLFGGIGTIIGTVIGVFIPAVLENGFVILGIQPFWQQVAVGVVLVAAVWFDQYKRRSKNRS
jgi:ribose transport system permease protein